MDEIPVPPSNDVASQSGTDLHDSPRALPTQRIPHVSSEHYRNNEGTTSEPQDSDTQNLQDGLEPGLLPRPTNPSAATSRSVTWDQRWDTVREGKMPEHVLQKWRVAIDVSVRKLRARKIVEAFFDLRGRPCIRCGSMKLTESKFLINEYSKHQREPRPTRQDPEKLTVENIVEPEHMGFGPNGFRLGTLKEIHARHRDCPFCRLVTRSLNEQPYQKKPKLTKDDRDDEDTLKRKQTRDDTDADVPISVDDWPEKDAICYARWQVDGRVIKHDTHGNIVGSRACTRRIRLHWSEKEFRDTYVVLMANPTRGQPGLFLGQTLQSSRVDPAKIRKWTEYCVNSHGAACQGSSSHDLSSWKSFFGVIDVDDMRLTSLPSGKRYVALSYVWGKRENVNVFTTTETNIKSLLTDGGIRKNLSALPRTICEAIDLVRAMGERYLWVDALCIIQGNETSWNLNSRVMDQVYGNAYLTICAADGQDASAGLTGLYHTERAVPPQIIEQYSPEVRLMATQPAETYIQQSVWDKRAWTFQERLLSKRTLIFVAGRVYLQCRHTARSVDIITASRIALTVYKKFLELYLTRKLSYPKDILAAFNGIGNLVCEALGGNLVHGLPSSHFDWALLWEVRDAGKPRPDKGDQKFPSWSWCGFEGDMREYKPHMLAGVEGHLHEWLTQHTFIEWYIRDFHGNLRLVWESGQNCGDTGSEKLEKSWRGYCKPDSSHADVYDKYGRPIREEHRDLPRTNFKLTLPECPYGVNIIDNSSYDSFNAFARNNPDKDLQYLQFFTWSAFFRIQEDPPDDFRRKSQRYSILDYKDDWCGTVVLERLWAKKQDIEKPLEFIAISEAKRFDMKEYDGWAYYIPKEREQSSWDLYYVFLIEYRNEIAYRVGLGKVFKDAFSYSCKLEGKQWKEFILG